MQTERTPRPIDPNLVPGSPEYIEAWTARQERTPDGHIRAMRAHAMVAKAVRKGWLVRGPCEVCGAGGVEAHHDDYDRPLDVRWLCSVHHAARHMQLRGPVVKGTRNDRISWRGLVDSLGFPGELPVTVMKQDRNGDGLQTPIGVWVPIAFWDEL